MNSFASEHPMTLRIESSITCSVGTVGDSYDNALAESAIGLYKKIPYSPEFTTRLAGCAVMSAPRLTRRAGCEVIDMVADEQGQQDVDVQQCAPHTASSSRSRSISAFEIASPRCGSGSNP
jgi:transposase InsO family protein